MEESSHASARAEDARAEDAPDWDELVRRRLPGYIQKEICRQKRKVDRLLNEEKNFPTKEQLGADITRAELREWRESSENEIEKMENAISDPVGWLRAEFGDNASNSDRRDRWIFSICESIDKVFEVVGVFLSIPERRNLERYCEINLHEFRALIGAADTFRQIGRIWDGFKTEYPNIPDLPADGPITHDGTHGTVSDQLAPEWDSLVRRRLPGYLHKEIRRLENKLDRLLQEEKNFPTDEDLEHGVTTQELRDWRESTEEELEEMEKAISDPVGWLLGTKRAKRCLMAWTSFRAEFGDNSSDSERRRYHISSICLFVRDVFAAVGVVLNVTNKQELRAYCGVNMHKFRAPDGAADTFGQIGRIWDGFKAEYPNIPDLPADGPIIHDGTHGTVSDQLVSAVMSSLAGDNDGGILA